MISPEYSTAGEGLQRGKAYLGNGQELCIYYPIPYASPPNLEFEEMEGKRHLQIVDQKPDHVRIKNLGSAGFEIPWKARGILVTSGKATVTEIGVPPNTQPVPTPDRIITQGH